MTFLIGRVEEPVAVAVLVRVTAVNIDQTEQLQISKYIVKGTISVFLQGSIPHDTCTNLLWLCYGEHIQNGAKSRRAKRCDNNLICQLFQDDISCKIAYPKPKAFPVL